MQSLEQGLRLWRCSVTETILLHFMQVRSKNQQRRRCVVITRDVGHRRDSVRCWQTPLECLSVSSVTVRPRRAGRKAHYGRPANATGRLARRAQQDPEAGRPVQGGVEQRVDHRGAQCRPRAVPDHVREFVGPADVREANSIVMLICLFSLSPAVPAGRPITVVDSSFNGLFGTKLVLRVVFNFKLENQADTVESPPQQTAEEPNEDPDAEPETSSS